LSGHLPDSASSFTPQAWSRIGKAINCGDLQKEEQPVEAALNVNKPLSRGSSHAPKATAEKT
jgi:hypothetical protein